MTQEERRIYLICELLKEQPDYRNMEIPQNEQEQKRLLRSLFNIRPPYPAGEEFLRAQDMYLQEETRRRGITDLEELTPVREGVYIWQGDITTLRCDAIVNAANSQMLGCFVPCHGCIDNVIHTFAGVQLRLACAEIMRRQGYEEPTGNAKITPAFNLPSKYILHTVGPIIHGPVRKRDCDELASCYRSCLELAVENGCRSIAFCCISTGEFHFPNEKAAETAIQTVISFLNTQQRDLRIIFNVFKDTDLHIYQNLLGVSKC